MTGKLYVFEGLDGCGKTSQIKLAREWLKKKGRQAVLMKDPDSNTDIGRKIRSILDKKTKVTEEELQNLFIQNRKELLENIVNPVIQLGGIMLLDRYYWSTLAYGTAAGLNIYKLMRDNFCFPVPDITFIFNVSAAKCVERMKLRGGDSTYFERGDKLARTTKVYLQLADMFSDSIHLINGELSKEEVFTEVKKILENDLI